MPTERTEIEMAAMVDQHIAEIIAQRNALARALSDAQKLLTGIYAAQFQFNPDDPESVARARAVWLDSPKGREFATLLSRHRL